MQRIDIRAYHVDVTIYRSYIYLYNIENAINHIAHVLSVCSNSAQSPDILYIAGSTPLSQIVWPGAAPCCVRV